MIKSWSGEPLTPKQKAQDLLMDAMMKAHYQVLDDPDMTEREKGMVSDQLEKQKRRVERLFGYEEDSWQLGM